MMTPSEMSKATPVFIKQLCQHCQQYNCHPTECAVGDKNCSTLEFAWYVPAQDLDARDFILVMPMLSFCRHEWNLLDGVAQCSGFTAKE